MRITIHQFNDMNDISFIVMLALLLLRLIGISISDNLMEQHDTVFGDDKELHALWTCLPLN